MYFLAFLAGMKTKLNYRISPRIGRTFFKEKTFEIWGAANTRVQEF